MCSKYTPVEISWLQFISYFNILLLIVVVFGLIFKMAPDYDHLTLMEKVEVFEHALEHTQGDDLAKILWYKSPSSEVSSFQTLLILFLIISD